jgi:hypothetical protein
MNIKNYGPSCSDAGEIVLQTICDGLNSHTVHFIDSDGRKRKGIEKLCLVCSRKFISRLDQEHKTCSTECRHILLTKRISVNCAYCKKQFNKKPSALLKSKSRLYFCSRKCKDNAQKLGGIKEIMPPHYGTAKIIDYRSLFSEVEMYCHRCKYKEFICSIHIHHIDHNRENNTKENLLPLCANCHIALHNNLWNA